MWRKVGVGCVALAFGWLGTSHGQVKLERKYTEGATYKSDAVSQIEQKLTIAGMETETSIDSRALSTATVGTRNADGILPVEERLDSLQIKMSLQGSEYSFDSQNPDNKGSSPFEALRDVHKALAQKQTKVLIGRDNRVQAIELDQSFINGLPVGLQSLIKGQLDPENLKRAANQEHDRLPQEAVHKGDTWVRTENVHLGAGQLMTFQTEYAYQGPVEKNGKTLEQITSKVLSVMFSLQDSPLPLTLKSSDLKVAESQGKLLFDRERGRTVELHSTVVIKGELQFAQNGTDLPSKLELKIQTTVMEQ